MKRRRVGIGRFRLTMEKILSLIILTILGFRQNTLTEVNLSKYKQITAGNEKFGNTIICEGKYPHHLQGVCRDDGSFYWSFTTTIVKTDLHGKTLKKIEVPSHHGDLCYLDGKVYVAVNFGAFNDPKGNADNWVYVYSAKNLSLLSKHKVQEVKYGAGGIAYCKGRFIVVGGLPEGLEENYVYEYDLKFNFIKHHVIKSGWTRLGIQTATFVKDYFWFGCYGNILLKTTLDFNIAGKYNFTCGYGILRGPTENSLYAGAGNLIKNGCDGNITAYKINQLFKFR